MILRLTRTTAELLGETSAEWAQLEKCVRLGQWTSGPRMDEDRLRQIAVELGVSLRMEGVPVLRSRPRAPAHRTAGVDRKPETAEKGHYVD